MRLNRLIGEISGAFADLGTFLPLVVGVLAVRGFDPTGVLVGFGLFALATAAIYRRPVPVQPMKAVAAVVIAAGLTPAAIAASGLIMGLVLAVLAVSGVIGRLERLIPQSVLLGIQLGIGAHLALVGFAHVAADPLTGGLALALLVILLLTPLRALACLVLLALVVAWQAAGGGLPSGLTLGFHLPGLAFPTGADFVAAAETVVLPQLALTLTNAVLATAAIAAGLFPDDRDRITPPRLALTSGILNLLLAPVGALPMCHGAGGLVVQHRFGARTGLAPAIFGLFCLGLGVSLGPGAVTLLAALPIAALGALLVVGGADLAFSRRLFEARLDCLPAILATAVACVTVNVAVGLAAGLAVEVARGVIARAFGRTRPQ
ncbi:MAG TPA: putative sulfate/molybdate transporter [Rhodospirillales bacterium]|jgi:SulP family sulfate permease